MKINEVKRCIGLLKMGSQALAGKIMGGILLVLGIGIFFGSVKGAYPLATVSAYFISMALMFYYQPIISFNYLKQIKSSPLGRTASVSFMPFMTFVLYSLEIIFFAVCGGIISVNSPSARIGAIYAMLAVVLVAVMMGTAVVITKLNGVFFMIDIAVFSIIMSNAFDMAEKTSEQLSSIPMGLIPWAAVSILALGVVCLGTYGLLAALYKKPFSKLYTEMAKQMTGEKSI